MVETGRPQMTILYCADNMQLACWITMARKLTPS